MNTEKFTPGPWTIYYPQGSKSITVILGEDDMYVATVSRENGRPVRENAKLIIAAPDMYEALKHLVQICENDELMFSDFPPLKTAKAALLKAVPNE